jgi:uncharacterized protein YegJ (DUF2314 family)
MLTPAVNGYRFEAYELDLYVHSVPVPYTEVGGDLQETAGRFPEARMRAAFAEHEGWLAVDVVRGDAAKGYHTAGRILAELIDDTTVAILAPTDGVAVPFDPSMAYELRIGNAQRLLLEGTYGTGVEATDEAMAAAIAEARLHWPEFVASWSKRGEGDQFKVKSPFREGDNVEHTWVAVESVDGDEISGTLINDPFFLTQPRVGSKVTVSSVALSDWSIEMSHGRRGNFTHGVFDMKR